MAISRDKILQALASFETVRDVAVDGSSITISAKLEGKREELGAAIRKTALAIDGVQSVEMKWVGEVGGREIRPDDPLPSVRNVVLVMSGKGGVGKSTV